MANSIDQIRQERNSLIWVHYLHNYDHLSAALVFETLGYLP